MYPRDWPGRDGSDTEVARGDGPSDGGSEKCRLREDALTRAAPVRQLEVVRRPEPVATWGTSVLTKDGLSPIWNLRGKIKAGYDGRETRRKAWIEDVDMTTRVATQ